MAETQQVRCSGHLPLTASSSVNFSIDTADSDTESRRANSSATFDLTDMPQPLLFFWLIRTKTSGLEKTIASG